MEEKKVRQVYILYGNIESYDKLTEMLNDEWDVICATPKGDTIVYVLEHDEF